MNDQTQLTDGLFKAGAHYGYSKSRRHASVAKCIFGTKNKADIIDLAKTAEQIAKVQEFLKARPEGAVVLFVGTKPEARALIKDTAEALGMPYVTNRWIGGALTNYSEVKRRIAKLVDLREKKIKGELDMYTKKERLMIDREVADMEGNFSGIVSLKKTPDIMVVIDPKKEHIAVAEAMKMGVPVLALANTDCDIRPINYPVVANDASTSSISFFMNEIKSVL